MAFVAQPDRLMLIRNMRVRVTVRFTCIPGLGTGVVGGFREAIRTALNQSAGYSVVEIRESYETIITPGITDWLITLDLAKDFTPPALRTDVQEFAKGAIPNSWCFTAESIGAVEVFQKDASDVFRPSIQTSVSLVAIAVIMLLLFVTWKDLT